MLNFTEALKKCKFLEKIAKISSFWKKMHKFQSFWKKLQISQDFGRFFVASDLILKKIWISLEFKIKLKLYFNWHHVETLIQNFEWKYGFFHNFTSK